MTKKEKEALCNLATILTRCQVLEDADMRKRVIVYGTHSLWNIIKENLEAANEDMGVLKTYLHDNK